MSATLRTKPQQKRAEATLAKITTAAVTLYNNPLIGRDRMSTGQVAVLAGVPIGSVYRYFTDRVALLDAIAPDRDMSPVVTL